MGKKQNKNENKSLTLPQNKLKLEYVKDKNMNNIKIISKQDQNEQHYLIFQYFVLL